MDRYGFMERLPERWERSRLGIRLRQATSALSPIAASTLVACVILYMEKGDSKAAGRCHGGATPECARRTLRAARIYSSISLAPMLESRVAGAGGVARWRSVASR